MNKNRNFPRLRVDPLAGAVFLGLLLTDRSGFGVSLLLAAAAHEAGHLLAAAVLKISVVSLRLGLLGARIETRGGVLGYGAEWKLAAAGPAASFACAAAALPFRSVAESVSRFCAASFLLGLLNLLPVETFDGGRMARCMLAARFGDAASVRVCRAVSFCVLFLLWCVSVYLLLRAGSGVSWLGFSMSLFARFFDDSDRPDARALPEHSGEKTRQTEQNRGKRGKL